MVFPVRHLPPLNTPLVKLGALLLRNLPKQRAPFANKHTTNVFIQKRVLHVNNAVS